MTSLRRLISRLVAPCRCVGTASPTTLVFGFATALTGIVAAFPELHAAESTPNAVQKASAEPAPSDLAKNLIGTWMMVEDRGVAVNMPEPARRYKSFDGREWLITQSDPATKKIIYSNGGTYTIEQGDIMVTTNRNTSASTTLRYRVWIKADILTQQGIGNPYSQVWKRVSSEMPAKALTEEVALRKAAPANQEEKPLLRWEAALSAYARSGRTSNVLKLLQNLRRHLQAQGQQNTDTFTDVSIRLAVYQREMGDYEGATKTSAEGAEVAERLHGFDSQDHLEFLILNTLLLERQQRYAEAEALGRQVLRRVEPVFGLHSNTTADALETLTITLLDLKKFQEAEVNLRRILEIRRKTHGEKDMQTGESWNNLGTYYLETDKLADAREALTRGAKIIRAVQAGNVVQTRLVARNLVRLALDEGNAADIRTASNRAFLEELKLIKDVLPSLGEDERLSLMVRLEPVRWYATIGEPEPIATAVLQTKAITLDQLLAAPASPSAYTDEFANLLRPELAGQGMEVYVPNPKSQEATPPGIKQPISTNGRYAISPAQIGGILPRGTSVVEIVRYNHYLGRFKDEWRYGALIFLSRQSVGEKITDQLIWVPLGAAEPIDREITALERDIRDPLAAGMVSTRLRMLYDLTWAPVAKALPADTENVFICPDGQTCFLPFGALLDPDKRFLGDKQLVMYLSTARDLFQFGEKKTAANRDFTVFAAPTYGQETSAGTETQSRFRDVDTRALSGLQLADLPGSRTEAELLRTLASQQHFAPTLFLGDSANKQNVQALHQPRVVHFATHGFFLPPSEKGPPGNPMDRSGLALAGAHVTLKSMAEGRALPDAVNDGLLTARDVARLPLAGTWIATLSACDTGRGEARDGEGVLGLRRGFLAAGVQNLMITLWKISDRETAAFMRDFYERALESSDPAVALALTQREWLARIRSERGIAAAVTSAGAFVLNTSGRLPKPTALAETK